tara:strand:- start:62 stop:1066 length:1005 start_codon:yes stop_codon:yes gene_type:complete
MIYKSTSPLRVSLFGGGTDYPEYFKKNKGAVLGFAINKYIYCTAIKMHGSTKSNFRISYKKMEEANKINEIKHPVILNILKDNKFFLKDKWHFVSLADLPTGTGLGSSSSFSVCFSNLIYGIQKIKKNNSFFAKYTFNLEKNILKENVGVQDSLFASYGGFNLFKFNSNKIIKQEIKFHKSVLDEFNQSLMLIYIGGQRKASKQLNQQLKNTINGKNISTLSRMYQNVFEAKSIIESSNKKDTFKMLGELMKENWDLKKSLSKNITSNKIDQVYTEAINSGAYGGKLCGAGGNGFMFFLIDKNKKKIFINKFKSNFICTEINIDFDGVKFLNEN